MIEQVTNINKTYSDFIDSVFNSEIISEREQAMVALAAVVAFEDESGIKNALLNAKAASLTNEEIGYVISVVIALKTKKIEKLASLKSHSESS
ncbi:hypothetical protein, partial [Anaerosporobacter sp.]